MFAEYVPASNVSQSFHFRMGNPCTTAPHVNKQPYKPHFDYVKKVLIPHTPETLIRELRCSRTYTVYPLTLSSGIPICATLRSRHKLSGNLSQCPTTLTLFPRSAKPDPLRREWLRAQSLHS